MQSRAKVRDRKGKGLFYSGAARGHSAEENNEQMLSELGKKYWVPPTRATLAGAAWLPRGAAGTGVGDGGFTGLWLYWCLDI